MKHYDYIFAGSGLAALMAAYKIMLSKELQDKTILLIDPNPKKTNDRTWCFWEKPSHSWQQLVSKKWDYALFSNKKNSKRLKLTPYTYNMIRGLDFYNFIFEALATAKNITFLNEKVIDYSETNNQVWVRTPSQSFSCEQLFSSIYNPTETATQKRYPVLQQHFVGWFIQSEQEVFDPETATFMDFSVNQKGNTRFMYVLPTSTTQALLEPTLFSHNLLKKEEYEQEIIEYIQKLGIKNYTITEKERGRIPMTCHPFWKKNTKNILYIGTAGGWSKPSTGFTFYHTDKKTSQLITLLEQQHTKPNLSGLCKKTKFWYYDLIFLDVLDKQNQLGAALFSSLLLCDDAALVFKFLNEETTLAEDLKVMWKCPKIPFIKALFRVLASRF